MVDFLKKSSVCNRDICIEQESIMSLTTKEREALKQIYETGLRTGIKPQVTASLRRKGYVDRKHTNIITDAGRVALGQKTDEELEDEQE